MKNHVLTIEQMQTLIDKGVDVSGASHYYEADVLYGDGKGYDLYYGQAPCLAVGKVIHTFNLQDIIDILPKEINGSTLSIIIYADGITHFYYKYVLGFRSYDALDAANQILNHCIDNNYIKTTKNLVAQK